MRFLSVCSGIEAASVAWNPLGWKAAAFSEIEPFPCAVLAHHYPDVPNRGDMTQFHEWPDDAVDLLCGGTPCQSFSVAGLRKGLDDPRGNLMLTYGAIAAKYRPRWLVWENVPGVLSSNGGRDFGAYLGMLGQLGYGVAYRVLDAQYFGVAQRRRRVFVVGCLGDWRSAAAVLFERHSVSGHPAPSRQAGKGTAARVAPCIDASFGRLQGASGQDANHGHGHLVAFGGNNTSGPIDCAAGLNAKGGSGRMDFDSETFIAHSLRGEGFDASEDGTGRGTPLVPVAVDHYNGALTGDIAGTLSTGGATTTGSGPSVMVPVAFDSKAGQHFTHAIQHAPTLRSMNGERPNGGGQLAVAAGMQVRRLTPRECERLQGFPDDYTLILYRGKPAADGPRYKALGNSWAVPCARWIGQRINAVEAINQMKKAA